MIDMAAACRGDRIAMSVSDPPCSKISPAPSRKHQSASVQTSVDCLYRVSLPGAAKPLLVTLTWCRAPMGHGLTINLGDGSSPGFKINTASHLFRRRKGAKSLDFNASRVEVAWDLSSARYVPCCPEPESGFYVVVTVDSEVGVAVGDLAGRRGAAAVGTRVVSRREHFSGRERYSTKVQFCDSGAEHEILIRCRRGGEAGAKPAALWVWMDRRSVVCVERLQWNFRGNQTIFVDGLLVDLMWDVYGWLFRSEGLGPGVFMFKTRRGVESSRLWVEERKRSRDHQKERGEVDFSLFIYACRSP